MGVNDQFEKMERFRKGSEEAVAKGCGGAELVQIAGGPWLPCPGCKDCDPEIARLLKLAKKAQAEAQGETELGPLVKREGGRETGFTPDRCGDAEG